MSRSRSGLDGAWLSCGWRLRARNRTVRINCGRVDETWVVNPSYATSTVKLFDQPLPNSMKTPKNDWGKC